MYKEDLAWAASQGLISTQQADTVWKALKERAKQQPTFNFTNVAYYFGALVVIAAMSWFMIISWESLGGVGIFSISFLYALFFVLMGHLLWKSLTYQTIGGLFIVLAVCMVPLIIYGGEKWLGFWPTMNVEEYHENFVQFRSNWVYLEIGTIVTALAALYFIRFPFLVAPLALAIGFLSLDIYPFLLGQEGVMRMQLWTSLLIGLGMIAISYAIDRYSLKDFAFWGYFFGLIAFWSSLTFLIGENEWHRFIYFLVNLGLIGLSILLDRRAFIVFGALGVLGYLYCLAYDAFSNSLLFPVVLSFFGLVVIYLGALYHKYQVLNKQKNEEGK